MSGEENEWDECAAGWDDDKTVRDYSQKAFDSLGSVCGIDISSCRRILDFGCGTGVLTEKLADASRFVVALDGSPKMIEVLSNKQLPNVTTISEYLTAELISSKPELQEKFDLIVASSVMAFVPDFPGTIKLLKSLLRTDGGVFVQWDWPLTERNQQFGLTEEQMYGAYATAGFSADHTQVVNGFPFAEPGGSAEILVLMGIVKT